MLARIAVCILASAILGGCTAPVPLVRDAPPGQGRALMVFIDGTANAPDSNTNVWQLRELARKHAPAASGDFYIEGPGAHLKPVGMASGWGTGYRIREAYLFLMRNYRPGDRIYLFGFSRGAYAARILASTLDFAGLPRPADDRPRTARRLAAMVYDAYKADVTPGARRIRIDTAIAKTGATLSGPIPVHFMGLWDTVEAMGLPEGEEVFSDPNAVYADQLCNVRRAMQAMSLDDDRATEFTPLPLTRRSLLKDCSADADGRPWTASRETIQARLDDTVDEVWFIGAHSDVGGGYEDGTLSGISLAWMIDGLVEDGLLPPGIPATGNPMERVHDPQTFLGGRLYTRRFRNLPAYTSGSLYNGGRLKVHPTVLARIRTPPSPAVDDFDKGSPAALQDQFPFCFRENGTGGYDFLDVPQCRLSEAKVAHHGH